jgi:DnaJ-class molecular chaperone
MLTLIECPDCEGTGRMFARPGGERECDCTRCDGDCTILWDSEAPDE